MKPKMMLKMGIDLVMTVLLLCQMAYMLVGETVHEYLGTAMFVLFILHHLLNRNWYRSLKKGRYGAVRILQTAVNALVLLCMLGLMVSGVILSREVFAFLPIQGGMGFARILHMLASYWGFVLMSVHLGLHWGMVMGMQSRRARLCRKRKARLRAPLFCACWRQRSASLASAPLPKTTSPTTCSSAASLSSLTWSSRWRRSSPNIWR